MQQPRPLLTAAAVVAALAAPAMLVGLLASSSSASAATITASYVAGHRDVVINGYGASGLGTFTLTDGDEVQPAVCIEADTEHSTAEDAYRRVAPRIRAPELDALLWWLDRQGPLDDDTATAAAALAWYHAGAVRAGGIPVWADGSRDFAPVSPVAPVRWGELAPFGLGHPVGLTSGGVDLDAAEHRVAELHDLAVRLSPPWRLASLGAGVFEVRNSAGPIAGVPVAVTIERPGAADVRITGTTGVDGRTKVALPPAPDGATVRAAAESPGPHAEWDGVDTQRLATATSTTLTSTWSVPALPRHIEVHKVSEDPTIAVGGAVFEILDADGAVAGRSTTGDDGIGRFEPIDPQTHPGPWTLLELEAPPGLQRADDPVQLDHLSVEAGAPTLVDVVNAAATVDVVVRKRLSVQAVGPADRSGFEFALTRRADGRTRAVATGADGQTAPVPLALGTYDVCETEAPAWAAGLVDGGCVELVVDVDALGSGGLGVDYVNHVPTPLIDTRVIDPADGDRTLLVRQDAATTTVIDHVTMSGLVPGTEYTLVGGIVPLEPATTEMLAGPTLMFVAERPTLTVQLEFEVPTRSSGRHVLVERLLVGDTVVAEHVDLGDAAQTVSVDLPATPSTTTTTTAAPTTSTTSTTSTTVSTSSTAPVATVPEPTPPPTLPPTGSPEALRHLLDWADAGFVVGVALVALGATRRRDADGAGR